MKYCRYCGTEMNDDDKFCPNCGRSVNGDATKEKNIDESISDKSRIAAALLAWFFGTIGIHRLYLGKIRSGVFMLVGGLISIIFITIGWLLFNFYDGDYILNAKFIILLIMFLVFCIIEVIIEIIRLVDFIRILIGKFKDGNNKNLINW